MFCPTDTEGQVNPIFADQSLATNWKLNQSGKLEQCPVLAKGSTTMGGHFNYGVRATVGNTRSRVETMSPEKSPEGAHTVLSKLIYQPGPTVSSSSQVSAENVSL